MQDIANRPKRVRRRRIELADAIEAVDNPDELMGDGDEDEVPVALEGEEQLDLGQIAAMPVQYAHADWVRCFVSVDGEEAEYKVYFDFWSANSGGRRGWSECDVCPCIKYKPCDGTRAQFCAAMWLWRNEAVRDASLCRAGHLMWWPTEEMVAAIIDRLVLRDF